MEVHKFPSVPFPLGLIVVFFLEEGREMRCKRLKLFKIMYHNIIVYKCVTSPIHYIYILLTLHTTYINNSQLFILFWVF